MTSGSSSEANQGIRYFTGENEDGKEYKRWKVWTLNKLVTLDKLTPEARGPYVYTLLSGKALEAVEHLDPQDYHKKDGEKVLWQILDARFPQKETADELGEVLGQVFALKASEGENLKQWTARASELLDRCQRKTGVSFPDEARGWLLLNRAGLSDGEKAVVIARALGSLKRESIAASLRSCFPDYVVKKKVGIAYAEEPERSGEDESFPGGSDEVEFADVQQFLDDHQGEAIVDDHSEPFMEKDVAEVLAVSWKEKRSELNRLQKSRQFHQAKELKRSFRIEVEELKRKTKCNRCGKIGHWARECRSKVSSGEKGSGKSQSSSGTTTGAATVVPIFEDFVAATASLPSLVDQVRAMQAKREQIQPLPTDVDDAAESFSPCVFKEALLVSSAGFGVLDSGCGRTIIGRRTLSEFERMWKKRDFPSVPVIEEVHHFRFGNGQTEVSTQSVLMPVVIAGKKGTIKAAIVKGSAPLLISRSAMRALKTCLDFVTDHVTLFAERIRVPVQVNEARQYVLNVLDDQVQAEPEATFDEIMVADMKEPSHETPESLDMPIQEPEHAVNVDDPEPFKDRPSETPKLKIWYQHDFGTQWTPKLSDAGPRWSHVKHRVIRNAHTRKIIRVDDCVAFPNPKMLHFHLPGSCQDIITEFHHCDDRELNETEQAFPLMWSPTKHQTRQIESQVKACASVALQDDRCLVMEVFSPPRFVKAANEAGFRGRSYDLLNGVDLSIAANRRQVEQDLINDPPDLLILCPPCTHEGGWWHLNQTHLSALEVLQIKARSRSFIRWCCKLFRMQAGQGRRALFEHPLGSQIWEYDEVRTLLRRHFSTKLHQCMYGLQLPDSSQFIRKGTRLLLSHEDMLSLGRTCPGKADAKHVCHDVVKGSASGVPSVSKFAGRYPPQFVHAVLDFLPVFQSKPCLMVLEDSISEGGWQHVSEVLALSEAHDPKDLKKVIDRLHRNLGHPPKEDLLRILRNAQASEEAIAAAREHSCDFCLSQARPKIALPAQTNRVHDFNHQVGFDVKHLTGWKNGQKIRALNLVDQASSYQRMIPFFEQETSQVLFRLFSEHWLSPFGPPKEVVLDPARTNLGEDMVSPAEAMGIHIRPIAAEAHYQLGRTESHGGWFDRILQKMLETHAPSTKDEWLACVSHAHVKNQMLQVHGFSPHQFVFGRNPHVPSDLLSEPLQTAAATASLTDEALAKAQALRLSARRAVIELQDDKAIRLALNARPRKAVDFQPGDYVCYWRNQKWIQGKLNQGGRWYGCAIVLGTVGRNLVIMHRRQVFRVAPEQVRFATSEERTLLSTPQAELLGIKDLIDKGQLKSKQFVDLLPQSYPPEDSLTSPADLTADAGAEPSVQPSVEAPEVPRIQDAAMPPLVESAEVPAENTPRIIENAESSHEETNAGAPEASAASSSYGPVRRRVSTKEGPMSLWRPAPLQSEDFVEIMHDLVPHLVEQATQGAKREREETSAPDAVASPSSSRPRTTEVLSVEEVNDLLDTCDTHSHEILISEYMQKRLQKELPPSGNHPQLQNMVDEGKKVEWNTLGSKPDVLKIHYGKQAEMIRSKFAHRFIGSRFVLTRKACVEGQEVDPQDLSTFVVKARWCLQGHLDPDLAKKAETGALKSPTLSQLGRMTLMQIIASQCWELQLGDIRGAFLEAGPMEDCYRPLYAHQPPGGIPGLPPSAVIEVMVMCMVRTMHRQHGLKNSMV